MKQLWRICGRISFWVAWPLLWVYLRRGERSRVIVLNAKQEVLVVKGWLSGNGRWDLPGGGIHRGEDAAAGAVRELREETGLILEPAQLQYIGRLKVTSKGFQSRLQVFLAIIVDNQFIRPQPWEILAVTWLPLEAIMADVIDEQVAACLKLAGKQLPELGTDIRKIVV